MTELADKIPDKEFSSILDYSPDKNQLDELRQIIFGLTKPELETLQAWLKDEREFICDIQEALPDVITNLIEIGEIGSDEVIPFVEEALEKSILQKPHRLADILFPIMMPAIRKAIAESIKEMLDSLNGTLEKGFSPKRIGWRIKAIFGAESYAEIVLANAYIFQVKQVFLIHKETGLLLHEVKSGTTITKDGDMVSGMLTALRDFVKDSLNVEGDRNLDTISLSGYNIWLENSPYAIIAGVVAGTPPNNLRENFKESIEKVHLDFQYNLKEFEGDVEPFKKTEPYLVSCLQEQKKPVKKKPPYIIYFILILLFGFIAYISYIRIEKQLRWNKYIQRISAEPGIIVNDEGYKRGSFYVEGIKDPLANDPVSMLKTFDFADTLVNSYWVLFFSLEQEFILQRTRDIIEPPESVEFNYRNDTLIINDHELSFSLDKATIQTLNQMGIKHIIYVNPKNPIYENEFESIEDYSFEFNYNTTEIKADQVADYNRFIQKLKSLLDYYNNKGQRVEIEVNSYTSHSGNSQANTEIAYKRAVSFINILDDSGIYRDIIKPKVIFVEETPVPFKIRSISVKLFLK